MIIKVARKMFLMVAKQPDFHSLADAIFVQNVVSLKTESPFLTIANSVRLCYRKSKQTVSKIL